MASAAPTQLSDIKFVNDQERQYFAEAMVGEEGNSFLNTTIGRYLHGRAKQVFDDCVKEMFDIDPYTPEGKKKHAQLKQDAWCAQNFMKWCADAIIEGQQAATQLDAYRDEGE